MKKLFNELRRREVFRSVGLYIGGAWIVLQVADVVLPAYEAPTWVFRALITVLALGLPVAVVLAWTFDITPTGIHHEHEADAAEAMAAPTRRGRRMDLAVIGLLLVALCISLFVNFSPREPVVAATPDPISVLIADFDNRTGDTVFNGTLEQVLTMGLEESSFINAFDRATAERVLTSINGTVQLDAQGARLVSVREGINVVLVGELSANDGKYTLAVNAIDPGKGEVLSSFDKRVTGKTEVVAAVAELSRRLREDFGDVDVDPANEGEETFTTASLDALHDYVRAQRLARDGKDGEAIGLYESAVAKDPKFGRAWSGLAVSAEKLGRTDVSGEAWRMALELLESMTERERYRTAGVYYSLVARNSQKAIENYTKLVEKYPADDAAYNNLAVAYFLDLQFDKALEAGKRVLKLYPSKSLYHANYALFAMYAGDFEAATAAARDTLKLNPGYHKAYLPFAVAALVDGDLEAARTAYRDMAATGPRGASLANIGLADITLFDGDAAGAEVILREGIEADEASGNTRARATRQMMLADALHRQGRSADEVAAQVVASLELASGLSQQVPAALLYLAIGRTAEADAIAQALAGKLEAQQRAYAKLIAALRLQADGDTIAAIDELRAGLALADVWLLRYYLGSAYVDKQHYAEAVSEFTLCRERLGEAFSLFLNDTPTFRYTAELDSRLAGASEKMTTL